MWLHQTFFVHPGWPLLENLKIAPELREHKNTPAPSGRGPQQYKKNPALLEPATYSRIPPVVTPRTSTPLRLDREFSEEFDMHVWSVPVGGTVTSPTSLL